MYMEIISPVLARRFYECLERLREKCCRSDDLDALNTSQMKMAFQCV